MTFKQVSVTLWLWKDFSLRSYLLAAYTDGALELAGCDRTTEQWHLHQSRYFKGFFLGPDNDFMACWDSGTGWRGPYEHDGEALRKREFKELPGGVGCAWRTVQA